MSSPCFSGRVHVSQAQGFTPFRPCSLRLHYRSRTVKQLVRAAAASNDNGVPGVKAEVPLISSKEIGPIPYPIDKETLTEAFAFSGPAPERINGRVAMWAFFICSLTELTSGQSVAQQALAHPISATLLGLLISLATLAPKYVAGVSLQQLQDAASREGLPEKLRFFNKTHEIWLGRVAMIGIVGLVALETFLGHALFAR